jgi:hypothetical protein
MSNSNKVEAAEFQKLPQSTDGLVEYRPEIDIKTIDH